MQTSQMVRVNWLPIGSLKSWWHSLSLVRQFTLASSGLVIVGLGILGLWVSSKIEDGIKQHAAARTALYMESVIAQHLLELSSQPRLTEESGKHIDSLLAKDAQRMRITAIKIWTRDGTIVYANDKRLVGQRFNVTPPLARAWKGSIEIQFDDDPHLDHTEIRPSDSSGHLLEIYVPVRHPDSGEIVAVAEFYEISTELELELQRARLEGWFVTGLVCFSIIAGLYSIVARGSKIIDVQRESLANRVSLLSDLLRQNEELRHRVQQASKRSAEDTEFHLQRLGSDLHDGPAQLLALALLKLDHLFGQMDAEPEAGETVRNVLSDAMSEIRNISAGLALPEIEKLSLAEALLLIISKHERRTSTKVTWQIPDDPITISHPIKLCLSRVVQEGLSNAFRHADGVGQIVGASWNDKSITLEVSDRGPGFRAVQGQKRPSLGLIGLRNRLESFGGSLTISSNVGQGTLLKARLPISE